MTGSVPWRRDRERLGTRGRALRLVPVVFAALWLASSSLHAQTIRGRLLDAESGRPIDLGILVLLTPEQDTVTMTATTPDGRFELAAPEPGIFLVRASAFGYAEREESGFELGDDGVMDIELRIAPRPMELDEILVSTDRPTSSHALVQNGFVDRYRRGFGHFITPRDLERTVYFNTEALFYLIPGVRVVTSSTSMEGGNVLLGPPTDRVLMRNAWGSCAPTLFLDGVRTGYQPEAGLSFLVPIQSVEAVEVYARPVQVPGEFGGVLNDCGVIVVWTKR